jgi:hypothetical protein
MILLRSHPADATQIQRVAVPMPHNGIPLKRFFSAIAIVKKSTRKSLNNFCRPASPQSDAASNDAPRQPPC